MAKQFLPVVLETDWFSIINAGQVKQTALHVQTARGSFVYFTYQS